MNASNSEANEQVDPSVVAGAEEGDMKAEAAALRARAIGRGRPLRPGAQFGMALFVVLVGLPLVAIPSLRHRLHARVQGFYASLDPRSFKPAPVWSKAGENRYPVPEAFRVPDPPVHRLPRLIDLTAGTYRPASGEAPPTAETPDSGWVPETSAASAGEAGPIFRQGEIEREAYDLLLKSSEAMARLVGGSDPSLRFKSWSAGKVEGDAYLVDVAFTGMAEDPETHFIWKVDLVAKKVVPMSRNARALPRP
jgi:hypothetical protein